MGEQYFFWDPHNIWGFDAIYHKKSVTQYTQSLESTNLAKNKHEIRVKSVKVTCQPFILHTMPKNV